MGVHHYSKGGNWCFLPVTAYNLFLIYCSLLLFILKFILILLISCHDWVYLAFLITNIFSCGLTLAIDLHKDILSSFTHTYIIPNLTFFVTQKMILGSKFCFGLLWITVQFYITFFWWIIYLVWTKIKIKMTLACLLGLSLSLFPLADSLMQSYFLNCIIFHNITVLTVFFLKYSIM